MALEVVYWKDGIARTPVYDGKKVDYYIRLSDLEDILTMNDPDALTRIILDWKRDHPTASKEECMAATGFSQKTMDNLW